MLRGTNENEKTPQMSTAHKEYRDFLVKFLFPLLGIPQDNNIEACGEQVVAKGNNKLVFQDETYVYFCNDERVLFRNRRRLSEDNINLSVNIIQSFFSVAKYYMDSEGSRYRSYMEP